MHCPCFEKLLLFGLVISTYSVISQLWFIPWAPQRSQGIVSSSHHQSTMSNASACLQTHLQSEWTVNISWVSFWLRQHTWLRWSKAVEKKEHSLSAGSFYSPNLRAGKAEAGSSRVFAGQLVYSKWWLLDSMRDPKLCRSLSRNWHCCLLTLRESNLFQGLVLPSWRFSFRPRNCQIARLRDLPTYSQSPCEQVSMGLIDFSTVLLTVLNSVKWQHHRMIIGNSGFASIGKKN